MSNLRFLIVDGYPKASRDEFDVAGMKHAWLLYAEMLRQHLPAADYRVWFPSDTAELPGGEGPEHYHGVLWTGCNLTVYHHDDVRVTRQLELQRRVYAVGTPAYGSCWGLQIAAVAAGGEVQVNPRGREMGLARNLHLTGEGREHPFLRGKPVVYSGFISHLDMVTKLPPGATLLASNAFTHVQALAITHQKGTFWSVQYHPEYDLHEVARLLVARAPKLLSEKFFVDGEALRRQVEEWEALQREPGRKDLRWKYHLDDDVLDRELRQVEFGNWLTHLVKPAAAGRT